MQQAKHRNRIRTGRLSHLPSWTTHPTWDCRPSGCLVYWSNPSRAVARLPRYSHFKMEVSTLFSPSRLLRREKRKKHKQMNITGSEVSIGRMGRAPCKHTLISRMSLTQLTQPPRTSAHTIKAVAYTALWPRRQRTQHTFSTNLGEKTTTTVRRRQTAQWKTHTAHGKAKNSLYLEKVSLLLQVCTCHKKHFKTKIDRKNNPQQKNYTKKCMELNNPNNLMYLETIHTSIAYRESKRSPLAQTGHLNLFK